ncbi:MAG: glycosyltransferase family 2 protein [Bacteroidales bacterium]|jgi:cellulose synthase/poly-beta-1,6-N-acetylglucosamine synthase-like glycosyltransferase|nr:glycosyltransferase family 2 protein [Bacteroidales bacterium]
MYLTKELLSTGFLADTFLYAVNNAVLIVTCFIFGVYFILAVISAISLRNYLRKNSYVDYHSIILAPLTPSISIVAPAYNEERTIVENIIALNAIYYNNYEIIIINDGSKDNTFRKMVDFFELEKVNYYFDYRLPCQKIRGMYKSRNKAYQKLTVIDKLNGGKADALNAGINTSKKDLICCIDIDSIVEPDVLLKMVKPFMEETDKKVIGTGGVLRIANSCEIENGKIKNIHLSNRFLPRVQALEYTRAFLLSRMAWSHLDGLLLISGALGLFDKETVIQCGGYSTKTVGEDMELVVRMRRYMVTCKIPYQVVYIPDPLAWTEVPDTSTQLATQRNRWTRGTLETLIMHRDLFMKPKYGKFSILGYTYWLLFEWAAPLLEFSGYVWFLFLIVTHQVNWTFFLHLFAFVYTFAIMISMFAILFEEKTFHKYKNRRDVLKLILTALLEPVVYHPRTVLWAVRGNIDYLRGVRSWGKMERVGFGIDKKTSPKK